MDSADHPLVRVVVLNFDGGPMTLDCLDSLLATQWPVDRLELVLVDNGSLDNVAEQVRARYPQVRLLEPLANLGFAGGCNLGMQLAGQHDFVALVNNDATVAADWLRPLVESSRAAPDIGAVCAKMLFAPRYLEVEFDVPDAARMNRHDVRNLGVRLSGVRVDGVRVDDRVSFDEGFYGAEPPHLESGEEIGRWTGSRGAMRVAIDPALPLPKTASLRLSNPVGRHATVDRRPMEPLPEVREAPYVLAVGIGTDSARDFVLRDFPQGDFEEPELEFFMPNGELHMP